MFHSHVFSFFLLIFAHTGCNESAATEIMYTPSACKESVAFLPTREKTNPEQKIARGKGGAEKLDLDESPEKEPAPTPPKELDKNDKVNINEASATELEVLPGIGPALAKRILAYRKKRKFKRLKDIRRVKGIGYAKYKKLKEKIRLK